jgi:hypothetical protein
MAISSKLDDLIKTGSQQQRMDAQLTLSMLAGFNLSVKEACEALPRIQNHKWYISERLGRDVGLRVAAIDYFENIYEPSAARSTPVKLTHRLYCLARQLVSIYLTHQSWKAHDGVFVQNPDDFIWPEGWDKFLSKDTVSCPEHIYRGVKVGPASYATT